MTLSFPPVDSKLSLDLELCESLVNPLGCPLGILNRFAMATSCKVSLRPSLRGGQSRDIEEEEAVSDRVGIISTVNQPTTNTQILLPIEFKMSIYSPGSRKVDVHSIFDDFRCVSFMSGANWSRSFTLLRAGSC